MLAVEEIPNGDTVSRSVTLPQCEFDLEKNLIKNMFVNLGDEGESLIWRKYASADHACHEFGLALNRVGRLYIGFANTITGNIRAYQSPNGHGFSVEHDPKDGVHHAVVKFLPKSGVKISRPERGFLRLTLTFMFDPLIPAP
jgi:hypothetical protein